MRNRGIVLTALLTLLSVACGGGGSGGGASLDGGGGTSGGGGKSGSGGAGAGGFPGCVDTGAEPDGLAPNATVLPSATDCDETGSSGQGVLNGMGDLDWFRFDGSDVALCEVDPRVTLSASPDARVCIYFDCAGGGGNISCTTGFSADPDPQLQNGCCSDVTGVVQASLNCVNNVSDDATVYVRVDQFVDACTQYSFAFHY